MIITIRLNTENEDDREILRYIHRRINKIDILSGNRPSQDIESYEDVWSRTSQRSREVLKAWADLEPEWDTNETLGHKTRLGLRRFHATIANLGKWGKASTAPPYFDRSNTAPPAYKLHPEFHTFLQTANIAAPCCGQGAKKTNTLHSKIS